jgi:hypothetical protein
MTLGRPTDYNEEILTKAKEYLLSCEDEEVEKGTDDRPVYSIKVKLPTKGGLAVYLGVSRDTLYEWAKVHKDFSYIMERLGAEQEDKLINNGLSGDYNPTIAKVLLTKHGYREGTDVTSNDKELPTPILGNVPINNSNPEDSKATEEN